MKNNLVQSSSKWIKVTLTAGFLFLYLPLFVLIGYSFNDSRISSVWTGFSLKWYHELLGNHQLLDSAWMSIRIAFCSASTAIVLGLMLAQALVRYKKFKGKGLLGGMVSAPLVMPDIILGISLLLMFVLLTQSFGWPGHRGFLTIWLAHVTFCTSYTTVILSSRLQDSDKTLENAAMDLGASPLKTFIFITLPLLFPAIAAGWLLSFTLSLDDVVIASFVTGPGATTLPMMILSSVKTGVSPQINALATVLVTLVSLVTLSAWGMAVKAERKRSKITRGRQG